MYFRKKKKQMNKTRQTRRISGQEIPSSRKFPRCHQVVMQLQIILSSVILFTLTHWLPELFAKKAFLGHFGGF